MSIEEITSNHITKTTFVLVHAAWQGPYAWETVKTGLLKEGFQVEVIQLPGHGSDQTDPRRINMEVYIKHVTDAIIAIGTEVILLGHSLAGMIISGVAEEIPELIKGLVYIAAYVPENGQSAYGISRQDKQSLLGASLLVSEDQSEFDVKEKDIINIFAQDSDTAAQSQILINYRPEPAAPFSDAVRLTTAKFGRVTKYYIETLKDNGIGNDLQKEMIRTAGISQVYTIDAGHSPSLSKPEEVTHILTTIGNL